MSTSNKQIRLGMVGAGMIFDDTYRPALEHLAARGLFDPAFGVVEVSLGGLASRTGKRAQAYRGSPANRLGQFAITTEPNSDGLLLDPTV